MFPRFSQSIETLVKCFLLWETALVPSGLPCTEYLYHSNQPLIVQLNLFLELSPPLFSVFLEGKDHLLFIHPQKLVHIVPSYNK